jgi:hypothetical protein
MDIYDVAKAFSNRDIRPNDKINKDTETDVRKAIDHLYDITPDVNVDNPLYGYSLYAQTPGRGVPGGSNIKSRDPVDVARFILAQRREINKKIKRAAENKNENFHDRSNQFYYDMTGGQLLDDRDPTAGVRPRVSRVGPDTFTRREY